MSKGRKYYREFAKSKGYDCKDFVEVVSEMYNVDTFKFRDSNNKLCQMSVNYKDFCFFLFKVTELKKPL